jgi:hypothetical protein
MAAREPASAIRRAMVMVERSMCDGSTKVCIGIGQQPIGHLHAQSKSTFVLLLSLEPEKALLEITDDLAFRVVRRVG